MYALPLPRVAASERMPVGSNVAKKAAAETAKKRRTFCSRQICRQLFRSDDDLFGCDNESKRTSMRSIRGRREFLLGDVDEGRHRVAAISRLLAGRLPGKRTLHASVSLSRTGVASPFVKD